MLLMCITFDMFYESCARLTFVLITPPPYSEVVAIIRH